MSRGGFASAPIDNGEMKEFLRCGGCGGSLFARGRRFLAFPADADALGNAGLLHGDAVEHAARLHRLAIVGDDNELRLRAHIADQTREAPYVGFIEWRIHFVEDAEGAGLVTE